MSIQQEVNILSIAINALRYSTVSKGWGNSLMKSFKRLAASCCFKCSHGNVPSWKEDSSSWHSAWITVRDKNTLQQNLNVNFYKTSAKMQASFNQPWLWWLLQGSWGGPRCPSPAPQCVWWAGRDSKRQWSIWECLRVKIQPNQHWFSHVSPFAVWMALWSQESASGPDPAKRREEHQTDHFLHTKIEKNSLKQRKKYV